MFGFKKKDDQVEVVNDVVSEVVDGLRSHLLGEILGEVEVKMKQVMNNQDAVFMLKAEKQHLEEEIAKLKSRARLEETEFKGLIKLREDRLNLDLEKKSVAMEKDFNAKEMTLLKQGHEQHVKAIAEQSDRLDKFMKEAMACLKSATTPASTTVVK